MLTKCIVRPTYRRSYPVYKLSSMCHSTRFRRNYTSSWKRVLTPTRAMSPKKAGERKASSWLSRVLGKNPFAPESLDKPPKAPTAPPRIINIHGRVLSDEYAYMTEGTVYNKDTKRYIEAEGRYLKLLGKEIQRNAAIFYNEIKNRLISSEHSVPEFIEGYWYYIKRDADRPFDVYCRKKGSLDAPEEVFLDGNALGEAVPYLHITAIKMTSDHMRFAWLMDTQGDEVFSCYVKDIRSGKIYVDEVIHNVGNMEWLPDGNAFYYTIKDDKHRGYRVYLHELGTPVTDDTLIFEENDDKFFVDLVKTKDWKHILIAINSKTTSEYHLLDMQNPKAPPKLLLPRKEGVEYFIDHAHGNFYVITNENSTNYQVLKAPAATFHDRATWSVFVPASPHVQIDDAEVFESHIVLYERHINLGGIKRIRLIELQEPYSSHFIDLHPISEVAPGSNLDFKSKTLRLHCSTPLHPESTLDYNMITRELTTLSQDIIKDYNPDDFECTRVWVPNGDVNVPLTLAYHKSISLDSGNNPTLLIGYGAYGSNLETHFRPEYVSLLQRGWILALAHVRGGSELGRKWYEDGKKHKKRNSFSDFIACAQYLISSRKTSPNLLCAKGSSAGGLLIGVAANEHSDLFQAMIAKVPFVDVLTSMLDESLPLTVHEYDEWGSPADDPEIFTLMLGYDPYRNVRRQRYPHMLVSASTMDIRVPYWQPLKWVAKLRAMKTDTNLLALKVDSSSGHFGDGGSEGRSTEAAYEFAFLYRALQRDARSDKL